MKKSVLAVLSIIILSFTGFAQCNTMVTPTVTVTPTGWTCYNEPARFDVYYNGGGTNPAFNVYSNNIKLQSWQYTLLNMGSSYSMLTIMDINLSINYSALTFEMISNDPCASSPKTTTPFQMRTLPLLFINNPNQPIVTACSSYILLVTPYKSMYMNASFPGYQYSQINWYKGQDMITGATDSIFTATSSGQYSMYYVFSDNNGTYKSCATLPITLTIVDCSPFTTAITGPGTVIYGQQNVVYSVTNQTDFTYNWSVTGGTIVSGQNTNSITVNWDEETSSALARTALPTHSVSVTETNNASESKTITMDVASNNVTTAAALPLVQSGIQFYPNPATDAFNIVMPQSGTSVNYTITDLAGTAVANGTFTSTGGAEKITTDFNAGLYQVVLKYNETVTCLRLNKVQ